MIAPRRSLGKLARRGLFADTRTVVEPLSLYTLALALAFAICAALAFIGFWRRETTGALPFGALMVAAMAYALGSIFEIRAASAAELRLWLAVEYLGIPFVGPLWLLLALQIAGLHSSRLTALGAGLFAFGCLVAAAAWAGEGKGLLYTSVELSRSGPFSVPRLGKGPLYWANLLAMNLCLVAADAAYIGRLLDSPGAYRRQSAYMLIASFFPWGGMLLYLLRLSPYGLDLAPFGIPLSGVLFAWSLFRHRLLDLGLIAYERIFEGMREGVLVMDRAGRVVGSRREPDRCGHPGPHLRAVAHGPGALAERVGRAGGTGRGRRLRRTALRRRRRSRGEPCSSRPNGRRRRKGEGRRLRPLRRSRSPVRRRPTSCRSVLPSRQSLIRKTEQDRRTPSPDFPPSG